jgi:mono/diheme cytochrome c family protein
MQPLAVETSLMSAVRRHTILAVAITAAACAPAPAPEPAFRIEPPLAHAASGGEAPLFTVRLDATSDRVARLAKQVTEVADPVYKQPQTYETVALSALLDASKPADVASLDGMRLIFQTVDGYRARATMDTMRALDGRLALRDLGAEPGRTWRAIPGKPAGFTPAPFYLVWSSTNPDLPWPYAVTAIEVWKTEPVDLTAPGVDATARAGHAIFRTRCLSCHAVNGMGGAVGPELNVPANITEYWNRAALKQFILNPASIRRNARMPTLTGLSNTDVDAVIAYLRHMKGLKRVGLHE